MAPAKRRSGKKGLRRQRVFSDLRAILEHAPAEERAAARRSALKREMLVKRSPPWKAVSGEVRKLAKEGKITKGEMLDALQHLMRRVLDRASKLTPASGAKIMRGKIARDPHVSERLAGQWADPPTGKALRRLSKRVSGEIMPQVLPKSAPACVCVGKNGKEYRVYYDFSKGTAHVKEIW